MAANMYDAEGMEAACLSVVMAIGFEPERSNGRGFKANANYARTRWHQRFQLLKLPITLQEFRLWQVNTQLEHMEREQALSSHA